MADPKSRADRVAAIVRKLAPKLAAEYDIVGKWPKRTMADGRIADGAPYSFSDVPAGQRLLVTDDDGDLAGKGVGATREAAIADLEAKLGIEEDGE